MEDRLSEGAAWWFLPGLCPVHTRHSTLIMASICVFPVANDHPGVQERASYCP